MVEINLTIITIPLSQITKSMFNKQTIGFYVVSIDLKTGFNVVSAVVDATTNVMISSPEPCMVKKNILVVDFKHTLSSNFLSVAVCAATNTAKDI